MISGNAQSGVSVAGTDTTGVVILGNRIGTDITGTAAMGNGAFGILVNGAPGVTIGGTARVDRNIVSANRLAGIGLYAGTTGALVEGNLIGTDITGSHALGNGDGIVIDGGSSSNTIGGIAAGAGNTIAFSANIGVDVDATAGTGNEIRLNSIFSNTGLGIDLGGDGVTQNNAAGHVGPNDYQNFPVISAVTSAGGVTTVTGTLNSTPDTAFAIDFYTISVAERVWLRRGPYVLGSAPVATDGTGTRASRSRFRTRPGRRDSWRPPPRTRAATPRKSPSRSDSTFRRRRSSGSRASPSTWGRRSRSAACGRPTRAAFRFPTPGSSVTARQGRDRRRRIHTRRWEPTP